MATKTKLLFTLPNDTQQKYSLSREGNYRLGRSAACDITLDDSALDDQHGELAADETNESRWFLKIIETGSISILEDGTEQQIGHTHLRVSITQEQEPEGSQAGEADDDEDEDEETYEDEDEDEADEEEDSMPAFSTEDPVDNDDQLEALRKSHQQREIKNAVVLIVACAILSFVAGVLWRLMKDG